MSTLIDTSRDFVVHLPESTAKQMEEISRSENREVDAIIQDAVRLYQAERFKKHLDTVRESLPPTNYTEDDVESLVHEVRREMRDKAKTAA